MTPAAESFMQRWFIPGRKDEASGSAGNVGAPATGPQMPIKPLAKTSSLQSQQESKTDRRGEWRRFLFDLRRNSSLPALQRDKALSVWEKVEQSEPLIALPTSGVSEGRVYFGWNPGPRSLDVEIDAAGVVSWFFADHQTGVSSTSDSEPAEGYLAFVGLFRRR